MAVGGDLPSVPGVSSRLEGARRGESQGAGLQEKEIEGQGHRTKEGLSDGELRAVQLIADSLPKIAPNVLINHREELLPLILYAIERHPSKDTRAALIGGLFNLIKKPDEEQRAAIVAAVVDLAGRLGAQALEEEVLAHGWDELVHRNEEKRLLVCQLCPSIAPHVPQATREEVVLSLMLAVAEDPAALVREAAALHLAQLLPALNDISVYPQVEKAVFQLVCDSDGVVVDEALQTLVPAFVAWSIARKHPFGQLLRSVLQRLRAEVDKCPPLIAPNSTNLKRPEVNMRNMGEREKWNFGVLLRMLTGLLEEVRHVAYRTCPEALKHKEAEEERLEGVEGGKAGQGEQGAIPASSSLSSVEDDEASFITDSLLKRYASGSVDWPAFDWLSVDCLPTIVNISLMIPPKDDDLRFRMCTFLLEVSRVFGRHYLMAVVLPTFLTAAGHTIDITALHPKTAQKVELLRPQGPPAERAAKMCTLPLLLGGVLGSPGMKEGYLKRYLKEWVLASCSRVGAWSPASTPELIDSVRFLCNKYGEHRDTMCTVLWDLVVNTSPPVRATAAVLFGTLSEGSDCKKVGQQILPALVTLGADPVAEVKIATIGAFGRILRQFKEDVVVGKVKEQMDLFLEDGSHETSVAVLKALVHAVPVTTNSIREYLLSKVHAMATNPSAAAANIATRLDKTDAMCLAIRALEHTEMSPAVTSSLFLPTVQALLRDPEALEPGNKEALEAILKDRWAGQLGTLGKTVGKTLGILGSPSPQRPASAGSGVGGGFSVGGGGFSSFAAAFGGSGEGGSAWDTFRTSFKEDDRPRNKLFK